MPPREETSVATETANRLRQAHDERVLMQMPFTARTERVCIRSECTLILNAARLKFCDGLFKQVEDSQAMFALCVATRCAVVFLLSLQH